MTQIAWWLLLALVFSLPIEKAVTFDGLGTISRLIGFAAFGAGAIAILMRARRTPLRPPNAALLFALAFVLWSALTWLWSVDRAATSARILTMAQLFAMLWLIYELARPRRAATLLMSAYLCGAVVSGLWTMLRALNNQQTYYRRYATAGFDPNDLGVTLAIALAFALYLSLHYSGWRAALVRIAAAIVIGALLLTASRTALIAAYVAFLFSALTIRKGTLGHKLATATLLAILILGPIALAPKASRQRLATLPTEVTSGTLNNRTRIWKTGLKLLKRRWPMGVGSAAYPEAVRPWLGTFPIPGQQYTAHNTFLSVLVETGLPGFAIFMALLATLAWFAWTMPPVQRAFSLTILALWSAGVFTLSWESRKPTWLIFALIMVLWTQCTPEYKARTDQSSTCK